MLATLLTCFIVTRCYIHWTRDRQYLVHNVDKFKCVVVILTGSTMKVMPNYMY